MTLKYHRGHNDALSPIASDRARYDPEMLARDPDALVTLLAAAVTRSGCAWQQSLLPDRR